MIKHGPTVPDNSECETFRRGRRAVAAVIRSSILGLTANVGQQSGDRDAAFSVPIVSQHVLADFLACDAH